MKPRLAYIMGPSYSGSTLLTYLLAMHPEIATVGELKASALGDVATYRCSCGERITECEFWRELADRTNRRGLPFSVYDFGTHFRDRRAVCDRLLRAGVRGGVFEAVRSFLLGRVPPVRDRFRQIMNANRVLIDVVKEMTGKNVFLDGSKDPNRLMYLVNSGYWDVRVLYLVRDGRGVANSYMKHNGVPMIRAAREWLVVHRQADRVADILGDRVFRLEYERLCREPDQVLSEIFRFLDLPPGAVATDFRSVTHHILGNAMRMASTGEIRIDDKWRRELSEEDLAIFGRIGGALNRKYGYA